MTAVRHQTPRTVVDFLTSLHRTRKVSGSDHGGQAIRLHHVFSFFPSGHENTYALIPEAMIQVSICHPALQSLTH